MPERNRLQFLSSSLWMLCDLLNFESWSMECGMLREPLACLFAGTGSKAAAKELEKIDALFFHYADRLEDNCIG